jgi:hypothetical protein
MIIDTTNMCSQLQKKLFESFAMLEGLFCVGGEAMLSSPSSG